MFVKFIAAIIFALALLPFRHLWAKREENFIRTHLHRGSNQVYEIIWEPRPFFSRGGSSYEVTYLTPEYKLYRARCTIQHFSQLFWTEPRYLRQVTPDQWERMLNQQNSEPSAILSEKEQLLDSLNSPFKHERLSAIEHIKQLESVDEQITHLLKEIAISDPDLDVKAATKELFSSEKI